MRGIPMTSVARTICDLAATERRNAVEAAFQEALYREIVAPDALAADPRSRAAAQRGAGDPGPAGRSPHDAVGEGEGAARG